MGFGFRFLLVRPDGEPADPAAFLSAIPNWKPGDELEAGSERVRYRIAAIESEEPPEGFSAVFVVAPV